MLSSPTSDASNGFVSIFGAPDASSLSWHVVPCDVAVPRRRAFAFDDTALARAGHAVLPALLADWIDVAMAVYVTDRAAKRLVRFDRPSAWSRRLHVTVPVRRPGVWNSPRNRAALGDLLSFLTEDVWDFDFVPRHAAARSVESQAFLLPAPANHPVRVALLSGGLDSFAGAADQIAALPGHQFVFVSGASNTRLLAAQRSQVRALATLTAIRPHHAVVRYSAARRRDVAAEERTQRSRGFLYLTLGVVAALVVGSRELFVFENGVGAINLPLDATHAGAQAGRGVHPCTLVRMERLAAELTGRPFSIHNPFLARTKAEMCGSAAVVALRRHIGSTYSCDGFPVRRSGSPQCGRCTSCVLRRVAIERAGLGEVDPASGYLDDVLSPATAGLRTRRRHFQAMQWQAAVIGRCCSAPNPWESLLVEFPELGRVVGELEATRRIDGDRLRADLLALYTRYADEWRAFSERHCGRLSLA
jgi:7-cyano-7-deazaguanine synthase in queuosine biosynthesis